MNIIPKHQNCALVATALIALSHASFATPSGLNNIPTADVTPQGTFVLQTFSTLGNGDEDLNLGFKSGIDLGPVDFEFGLASHLLPDQGGPVTVHGKLAVPFGENLPTFGIGAANVTFSGNDADRAGDPFSYVVLSHDLGWLRAHAGVGLQDGDALPFFGVDKTFRITAAQTSTTAAGKGVTAAPEPAYRDIFTLRADAIQQHDSNWLFSAGVLVPVTSFFVFEAWGNFPDSGDDASLTLKANFVIKF